MTVGVTVVLPGFFLALKGYTRCSPLAVLPPFGETNNLPRFCWADFPVIADSLLIWRKAQQLLLCQVDAKQHNIGPPAWEP